MKSFEIDDERIHAEFHIFINSTRCPGKLKLDLKREKEKFEKKAAFKEPTSDVCAISYEDFTLNDENKDNDDAVNLVSNLHVSDNNDLDGLGDVNYGLTHDWSNPTVELSNEQNANVDTWLNETVVAPFLQDNFRPNDELKMIPTRTDGTNFELTDATADQKDILAWILGTIRKWFNSIELTDELKMSVYPLRMTIRGVAGSGKSTFINTLVTAVRRIFQNDRSCKVLAPTGGAAFNAGGETCHHGMAVSMSDGRELSAETLKKLRLSLIGLVCLIVDERSLLSSKLLARMELNARLGAFKGANDNISWGNIPIVLLVGDDYQLPSIDNGVLSMYATNANLTLEEEIGNEHFRNLANVTMSLKESKRQHGDQERFRRILRAIRSEPGEVSHVLNIIPVQCFLFNSDFFSLF